MSTPTDPVTGLAIFRADAGPSIGIGHVMRCLALADAMRGRGYRCLLATAPEGLASLPAGIDAFETLAVDSAASQLAQGHAIGERVGRADIVVADHYALGDEFERAARRWCRTLATIDDLADRDHACDILVDTSLGRSTSDYASRVPPHCRQLLGPAYAPLRPGFAEARRRCVPRPRRRPQRLLVSLGGTDADGLTLTALDGIAAADLGLAVDVVLPEAARPFAAVQARAQAGPAKITVHGAVRDPVDLMGAADLCIGAGGTASWERACLGLPAILLPVAENQRRNIAGLERAGAAIAITAPVTAAAIAAALRALVDNTVRLARMSAAAADLCDGRGAERICDVLASVAAAEHDPRASAPAGERLH